MHINNTPYCGSDHDCYCVAHYQESPNVIVFENDKTDQTHCWMWPNIHSQHSQLQTQHLDFSDAKGLVRFDTSS